ncbi:MAG: YfhO family protein [Chloroflexi bacterium]|nr:YfhO family protein [Chloroflexota bacterium]
MGGIRGVIGKLESAGWARDGAALALLLLVAIFVFRTDLTEGRIYYEADTGTYYYPVMATVDRAIDRSSIPLWTRHIFGGYPLFADGEGGVLYPPNVLLLWLLPIQQAFNLFTVERFFLAGAFLYAYCRTLGIGRMGSLVGAISFAYGSFMIGQLQHTNLSNGAIWLPLVLFFVELAISASGRRRVIHLLLAGIALAMQSLAVHIQPLIMTLLAVSLYVPFRTVVWQGVDAWKGSKGASRIGDARAILRQALAKIPPALLVLGVVFGIGLGLAAIQLIPLYELGQDSARGIAPTYWFATLYALPVFNLVTLVLPYFFVGPGHYGWSLWTIYESTVYVGIAPLMLALLSLVFVRRRTVAFFAFLAALSIFLAFGDYPPVKLYGLLWQLPGFHFLRAPGRFSFLFDFSLAILAAMGLDWLVGVLGSRDHKIDRNRALKLALFGSALVGVSALLVLALWVGRDALQAKNGSTIDFIRNQYMTLRNWNFDLNAERVYASLLYTLDVWNPATLRAAIFLLASPMVLLLWLRFRRFTAVWIFLLLSIVVVDLVFFALEFHPRTAYSTLTTPSGVTRFLVENNGTHRVYNKGWVRATEANRLMAWSVSVVGGYSSLSPIRNNDFKRLIERGDTRLLDLWNVRYVVTRVTESVPPEYRMVYQQDDVVVYENPHYLPRAFLVRSATVAANGQAALSKITESSFDASREVVLEGSFDPTLLNAVGEVVNDGSAINSPRSQGVSLPEYGSESVTLNTFSSDNAFLVLSDTYYPGWRVYVDGREAKIYRADYLFRGVYLPAGDHEVTFKYEPVSFYIGGAVSAVTLLVVVLALALSASPWPPSVWRKLNPTNRRVPSRPFTLPTPSRVGAPVPSPSSHEGEG